MSFYRYQQCEIESIIHATKRLRLRFCIIAAFILVASCVAAVSRPAWIFGVHERARLWVLVALCVCFAGPLADTLFRWRNRLTKLEQSLKTTIVEISSEAVTVQSSTSHRQLARNSIRRADEVPWGLYLRSANRYRWIFIPASVSEFDNLKRELAAMNIPVIEAPLPPNWEEFVGALLFTATLLCAIFAQAPGLLTANLLISLVIAVGGFSILSANPDNLPKMRWVRFATFVPSVMTASMLWTTTHPH